MQLSTEDKERIEQEAIKEWGNVGAGRLGFVKGAEYATKYEREQLIECGKYVTQLNLELGPLRVECSEKDDKIKELEAENERLKKDGGEAYLNGFNDGASEQLTVRDKVIRECIDIIRAEGLSTANVLIALINEKNEQHGEAND